jgi:hypothetical protein
MGAHVALAFVWPVLGVRRLPRAPQRRLAAGPARGCRWRWDVHTCTLRHAHAHTRTHTHTCTNTENAARTHTHARRAGAQDGRAAEDRAEVAREGRGDHGLGMFKYCTLPKYCSHSRATGRIRARNAQRRKNAAGGCIYPARRTRLCLPRRPTGPPPSEVSECKGFPVLWVLLSPGTP